MDQTSLPVYQLENIPQGKLALLNPLQEIIQPHLPLLHAFWWLTYTAVIVYLVSRFLLLPLLARASATPRRKRR